MSVNSQSQLIAKLNDLHRKGENKLGKVVFSSIVSLMLPKQQVALLLLVANFDDFNEDNDPYGEHDFGKFEYDSNTYFWKIDYYDSTYEYHSEDSSNPELTRRVMMIMHSSEY
jgi:Protein of unknown function (DUF3768)